MKTNRFLCLIFVSVLVISAVFANTTAYASSGSKKVTSNGSMEAILRENQSGNSNELSFRVTGLPANAVISYIEINTGSLSFTGTMLTNYLTLKSSNNSEEDRISWNGSANKTLKSSLFKDKPANGTYKISFNCTCLAGAIVGGMQLDIGTKKYTKPSITVYWRDTY